MKFHIVNLGCKVNAAETEQMARSFEAEGHVHAPLLECDVAVVNTCTVTRRADLKSLYAVRKSARHARHVFVTGCFSELKPGESALPGVTAVIPQREKHRILDHVKTYLGAESPMDPEALFRHHVVYRDANGKAPAMANDQVVYRDHARAFLKIQDGCNNFCTFCLIPFARGIPASRAEGDILEHVRALNREGVPEAVLTGINMGVWRHEGRRFADLLGAILEASGSMAIRLSSIEPQSLDPAVLSHFSHPNLVPHVHLPVQGGTDDLLSRMNRLYTTGEYRDLVDRMKACQPRFSISTDAIVGFPGETEEGFQDSVAWYESLGFSKVHVFPYSPRPGTRALNMADPVPEKSLRTRVEILKLRAAQWERAFHRTCIGTHQQFILETEPKDGFAEGTTDRYLKGRVAIPSGRPLKRGMRLPVRIRDESDLFEIAPPEPVA